MKNVHSLVLVIFIMSIGALACGSSTPTEAAPGVPTPTQAEPSVEPATAAPTRIPVSSPSPTTALLQLEIVQSQAWTDRDGNVRVNVLMRNPYDFPVKPKIKARAKVLNGAGEFLRDRELYFLDGISGGNGFLLPGETIAANACFTCEAAPLPEAWASVELLSIVEDATGTWDYSSDVEATIGNVSFDGNSPIFDVTGSVKNNSTSALDRISVRVFVYDQEDILVGTAEVSAWDVGPGATATLSGYGIGQAPAGPIHYEVTALGVKY